MRPINGKAISVDEDDILEILREAHHHYEQSHKEK
jgi:hypothetical protein